MVSIIEFFIVMLILGIPTFFGYLSYKMFENFGISLIIFIILFIITRNFACEKMDAIELSSSFENFFEESIQSLKEGFREIFALVFLNKIFIYFFITILILGGVGLFYFNYHNKLSKPQPGKTYWRYILKPTSGTPTFLCKAGMVYTCKSRHGFNFFIVNGKEYEFKISTPFLLQFSEDTKVVFGTKLDGFWVKSGKLEIWEGKKFNCKWLTF